MMRRGPFEQAASEQAASRTAASRQAVIVAVVLVFLLPTIGSADPGPAPAPSAPSPAISLDPALFPVPDNLRPNIRFWYDVFTEHDSNRVLLHDEEYLEIVYTVLDFSKVEASDLSEISKRKRRQKAVRDAEGKYLHILHALANGHDLEEDPAGQERVEQLFAHVPGGRSKYREAADRLRTQTGLQDRFETAIGRSGRYMAAMEEIFAAHGIPTVLTRMAFVESMFQEGARSKVGAGGIWQIMPATGRQFLNIGLEADERFDPLLAAEAAAKILKQNYSLVQSWPLAVTGYNYGINGMRRAVRRLGTRDPGVIFAQHKSRTFGFASRNFYSEFLAAAQAYENRRQVFPGAVEDPPLTFDRFTPGLYVSAVELAEEADVDLGALQALNPALNGEIWRGDLLIPKGYPLRVPEGVGPQIARAYDQLPDSRKSPYQAGSRHRVRSGETLSTIARRYGSSVAALQRANGLHRANFIRVGQVLYIPPRGDYRARSRPAAATQAQAQVASSGQHVVRRGETLTSIARRYGTSIEALQAANGLGRSQQIIAGRSLKIPGGDTARHRVRSGETLGQIARLYGTTVKALEAANDLVGHLIYPSQLLIIPSTR